MSKITCGETRWGADFISLLIYLGLILALLLAPQVAQGAANIATPAVTQTLDFGTFAVLPSCAPCSITLDVNGGRTTSGGVVVTSKRLGRPAQFTVTCNNGSCAYTPTFSGSPTFAAGVTMTINTFTFAKSTANTTSTLSVGAKLTIPNSGAVAGNYTSTSFSIATSSP